MPSVGLVFCEIGLKLSEFWDTKPICMVKPMVGRMLSINYETAGDE